MKQFVKEPGGVEMYDCAVNYIPGHNPDLVLESDGEEERISLTNPDYQSQEALHNLFVAKNVAKRAVAEVKTEM